MEKIGDVTEWFKNIDNKNRATFIIIDIENYYPSITSEILEGAISWAETYVQITNEEKEMIFSTKHNILYNLGQSWVKKAANPCDVTMGSWDGAEVS